MGWRVRCAGADPNAPRPGATETSVHTACAAGHLEVVKFLIANKGDIEKRGNHGFTGTEACLGVCILLMDGLCAALHYAIDNGHAALAFWLLDEAKANKEAQTTFGSNLAIVAAWTARMEILRRVVQDYKIDPHYVRPDGTSATLACGYSGNVECM